MLTRDPAARLSAEDALRHPWVAEQGVARTAHMRAAHGHLKAARERALQGEAPPDTPRSRTHSFLTSPRAFLAGRVGMLSGDRSNVSASVAPPGKRKPVIAPPTGRPRREGAGIRTTSDADLGVASNVFNVEAGLRPDPLPPPAAPAAPPRAAAAPVFKVPAPKRNASPKAAAAVAAATAAAETGHEGAGGREDEAWLFECACGIKVSSDQYVDPRNPPPALLGRQFECSKCQRWGHSACYPGYQVRPPPPCAPSCGPHSGARGRAVRGGGELSLGRWQYLAELPEDCLCHRCAKAGPSAKAAAAACKGKAAKAEPKAHAPPAKIS